MRTTHKNAMRPPRTAMRPMSPPIKPNLFLSRKPSTLLRPWGSGSTNTSFRFGNSILLGGFFGSKQYCWKHCEHIAERAGAGDNLRRVRSTAAHLRQMPKFGSGVLAFGVKPLIVLACTWSMKRRICFAVYASLNVAVLEGK